MKRSTDANGQIGRHLHIRFFHIPDDGLPTIVYMDVLDADKLLSAAGLLHEPSCSSGGGIPCAFVAVVPKQLKLFAGGVELLTYFQPCR